MKSEILVLTTVFGICFTNFANAQITIDSNEYNSTFGSQNSFYETEDLNGVSISLGGVGGPQTWEFDPQEFPNGTTTDYTIIDPQTTPFANDFPNSNFCMAIIDSINNENDYTFWAHNPNNLEVHGFGYVDSQSSDFFALNTPAEFLQFPLSLNTTWTSNNVITFNDQGTFIIDSTSSINTVDAWGTVETPAGTYNCLRIKGENTQFDLFYFNGNLVSADTVFTYTYSWVAEGIGMVAFVESLDDETNPNFTMADDVNILVSDTPVSIAEDGNEITPQNFKLEQNYPNPFNPSTSINYELQIANSEFAKLTIFNILGEKVQEFNLTEPKGTVVWNGTDSFGKQVSSGVYFYKLQSATQNQTRKMLLLK